MGCGLSRCWTACPTTATPAVRSSSRSSERSSPSSRAATQKARCFGRPSCSAAVTVREGVVRPWRLRSIALFQSRAPEPTPSPRSAPYRAPRCARPRAGRWPTPSCPARGQALDLLGRALDDHVADAQAHAAAFRGQAVHGAGQAVEAVARRLQRDADLPRVDGDAHPARGRLGRAHHPAGVERDLDAAVAAARQQVAAGEGGHEGVGRVRDELGRGALLAQAPVDDDPDAVGQRGGVAEVVGDEQGRQRQGAEHVLQLAAHGRARVRVERRERLVEEQDLRVARQGARDGHALALAARQPARALVGQVGDAARARAARARARRSRRRRRRWRRTVMCGKSAYSWKTRPTERALGRQVDLGRRVEPGAVAEGDAPAVGAPQPGDGAQHRRLAGARGPDERDGLALRCSG